MRTIFLALIVLVLPAMAQAQTAVCSRPPAPACADAAQTFGNADLIIACQGDVRVYLDTMPGYLECLRQAQMAYSTPLAQIQALRTEQLAAGAEMVDLAQRFNCRLMNKPGCS
ncbi:MAG: hypothetical protein GC191_07260 [Azospirillum sp.]|nr:hypothetical protein [Azospirillum sp.]